LIGCPSGRGRDLSSRLPSQAWQDLRYVRVVLEIFGLVYYKVNDNLGSNQYIAITESSKLANVIYMDAIK
jgi:hypothetical protein